MFIATNHPLKYSSLREERHFFPAGVHARGCFAPTERDPNCVTSGYKHLAPLGRNPTISNLLHFKLESTNVK